MRVYCNRCKAKKEIISEEEVFVTKGHRIIKGRCSSCGREIYKIIGKKRK